MQDNTLTTPVIEGLAMHEYTIKASIEMRLAGLPITICGTYNVHSNCFYPDGVIASMYLPNQDGEFVNDFDLEEFCEHMGWNYSNTYDEIQKAVETR